MLPPAKLGALVVAETPPRSYQDPYDQWLIRTAKEAVRHSRDLLEKTELPETQKHWRIVRDKDKKPPQAG